MGVKIFDILPKKKVSLKDFENKIIAIDSFLYLYQFLSTIRLRDGSLLTDTKGNVTSHLNGFFFRTMKYLEYGIKPVFIFDGVVPELKNKERERRKSLKNEAMIKYKTAKQERNIEDMNKFARRTTRLTSEMIADVKELITLMGLSYIDAPSEGEAQAAYIVRKGDAYAIGSNDADSLMFGAPRMIKNFSIAGRRKLRGKFGSSIIQPELIELDKCLNHLGVDRNQLIVLSMLVGTDYNIGGIRGIGPQKALKLIKEYGNNFDELFKQVKWDDYFDFKWTEVFYLIKNIPVTDDYKITFNNLDIVGLKNKLINVHDFNSERVESVLSKFKREQKTQKGLGDFF